MTQLLPPKKEVALALLERSNVDIYLDPRAQGVVVPPQFRKEPRLILKIGLNMPVPIPDLRLDDESMSCTLSFSRTPFFCVVPWPSVFAIVGEDGRGMVWPDDVPQELAVKMIEDKKPSDKDTPASPASAAGGSRNGGRGRRALTSVEDHHAESSEGDAPRRRPKKKKNERPTLVALPSPERERPAPPESARAARPGGEKVDKPEERKPEGRPQIAPEMPVVVRRPPPGPTRPKRELPPYLRVVK